MASRAAALLSSPRLPVLAALLGVLLTLPALGVGFVADDWYHRGMLLGLPSYTSGEPVLLDLFAFMPGPERNRELLEAGVLPWWSALELKAAFLRPVSALTHVLDYRLWPDAPALQHAHGLAWYAAAILAVASVHRRVLGVGAAAGLAAVLFAVDDSHAMAVGWIANRNALVALALGGLALRLHLDGRRALSVPLWGVALLAGESALGALAYVVAWELCAAPGTWRQRLSRLLPYLLLLAAWRLVYQAMGLGASGSDLYVDPGRTPWEFLQALALRWPLLAAGQVYGAPIDLWLFATRPVQVVGSSLAALAVLGLGWALAGWLRHPEARFYALGAALAAVPLCAVFPTDRLLLWTGLGAFGLLAMLVRRVGWLGGAGDEALPRSARLLVGLLLALHLPLAALLLPLRVLVLPAYGGLFATAALQAPWDAAYHGRTLVLLNGQELMAAYGGVMRAVARATAEERGLDPADWPVPGRVELLGSLMTDQHVLRLDAHTLEVVPEGGMLATTMDRLFWAPSRSFAVGERVRRPGLEIEVAALTEDGRPARVRYRFDRELDDPELVFMALVDGDLRPWPVPSSGEAVLVPASPPPLRWQVLGPLLHR